MISSNTFLLIFVGLAWQPAYAAPLYKWVDRAGNVTYSSLPPPAGIQAVEIRVPPHPTLEEIRQAEERAKRTDVQASELEEQRRKQEAAEAEEARNRALQSPPAPVVIEKPVYLPQPIYYPPPRRHHDRPPHPRPR